jgi:putative nucleotidyltransferase with HDIG domain
LHEAIKVLGFSRVKSIIITASTFQMFQSGTHAKIAHVLWEHSLATALAARLIAQKYGRLDKEEAYLCGLLHDIGKLVLLQTVPHTYEEIIDKVKKNNLPFIQVEGKELGFNHVNVGHELLTKWQFPVHLIKQISAHHSTKSNQREPSMSLGRVTAIANSIAKYIGASFFEAYQAEYKRTFFIGNKHISDDDLFSLRVDAEADFIYEINCIYE